MQQQFAFVGSDILDQEKVEALKGILIAAQVCFLKNIYSGDGTTIKPKML